MVRRSRDAGLRPSGRRGPAADAGQRRAGLGQRVDWAPDPQVRRSILTTNAHRLYGFPEGHAAASAAGAWLQGRLVRGLPGHGPFQLLGVVSTRI